MWTTFGGGNDSRLGRAYPAFPATGQQVRYREFTILGTPFNDEESSYIQTADLDAPIVKTTAGPHSAKVIEVDYKRRAWASYTAHSFVVDTNLSPAVIRSEMASGNFTVDGTVQLNGRKAVKISWVDKSVPLLYSLWVDAQTYVLLRSTQKGNGAIYDATTTYQMLPATPANLKLLNPVIPAGFTHAARLPG